MEYKPHQSELRDSKIYGEFKDSLDCPPDGSFCTRYNKLGIQVTMAEVGHDIDMHPLEKSKLPLWGMAHEGTWSGKALIQNVLLEGFNAETNLGKRMRAFEMHAAGSDYNTPNEIRDITLKNVEHDAMGWFFDPPESWAVIADCGEFPCTGPKNTIWSFYGTKFEGDIKPKITKPDFQIVPDVTGYSDKFDNCVKQEKWNGYLCETTSLAILLFESEDTDKMDRSMQPVYIEDISKGTKNKLNSFMDHNCDGFYTSQMRLSRFPGLVEAYKGQVVDVTFTGTPAKKMRWVLRSQNKNAGLTVRIAYPGAESRSVVKGGEIVEYNQWDEKERGYGPVLQKFCGENRFIGVKNILEFYMTTDCELQVQPRDAIQTLVRMEWTFNDFFAKGGTTSFIDRLTASLGIHASTVKIVSVYDGSLVLNYDLAPSKEEPLDLKAIEKKQTEKFATGKVDLGAPILDVAAGKEKVVNDGIVSAKGFKPVVITKTPTNSNALARQHVNLLGIWDLQFKTAGSRCEKPEREAAPETRPRCKAGLCCGAAIRVGETDWTRQIEVCHTRGAQKYSNQVDKFNLEEWAFACIEGASKIASASMLLALAIAYMMA